VLEDEFSDVLRKAMRGTGTDVASLAQRAGLEPREIEAWLRGEGAAGDGAARAIARVLRLDPGKLADAAAARWEPATAYPHEIAHHPNAPHPSNGYFFFLDGSKSAALVDPAGASDAYLPQILDRAFTLKYILITHKHADHCDATAAIARRFPEAAIVMHRADAHAIGELGRRALPIQDGDELPFGDGAAIRMLHTPGHTDGSSCFIVKSNVFTGDTLFAGSIGGAFGEATGYDDILASVREKIFRLPEETVVLPGHGPPTTIAQERAHNPFF
jgi:glyoxylase-like metal-dependent hydrolase (beta-lactamase superfamily II)